MTDQSTAAHRAIPSWMAAALVFFSSGTVLVLEILGIRLLAPYVGSSLDTYTAIIGTVLAGISLGTYVGGRLADKLSTARMLGPVLLISGATALFIVPATRVFGSALGSPSSSSVVLLSILALLVPAAVLSAISPIVVKLQLSSLQETGSIVGRLSAIGTAGAIAGTFLTGFVLLVHFRTSQIVITIGVVLILCGVAFTVLYRGASGLISRLPAASLLAVIVGVPLTVSAGNLCDRESPYYCMRLVADPDNPSGKFLLLDRLNHSYVDVDNPLKMEFWYVEAMTNAFDDLKPGADIKMLTIGGGGFTVPRYIDATRANPATTSLEIDPELVDFNRDRLALDDVDSLTVKIGDARSTIKALEPNQFDLVIADAFGNESVPWHLSTVEFARDVRRTMKDDGILTMNVIDFGSRDLLTAEMKTLREVWSNVAVIERRTADGAVVGGNFVVIASNNPISNPELVAKLMGLSETSYLVAGPEADALIADAPILTDEFAPADQLLANNLRNVR